MTLGRVGVDDPGERAAQMLSCGAQKGARAWSEKSRHGTPLYTETAAQGHGSPGSVWSPASRVEGLSGDSHECAHVLMPGREPPRLSAQPWVSSPGTSEPWTLHPVLLYFPVAGLWSLLSECLNN